jgi:methyl-accepting chemotaxis protein
MKKRSLRFKMMVSGVIGVFVPLLVVGGFSAYKASNALEESALSQSVEVAKGLANMVDVAVQEEIKVAAQIALTRTMVDAAKAYKQGSKDGAELTEASTELTALVQQSGNQYETVFIADPNGKVFVDGVNGKYKGMDLSERDYVKAAKAGKASIGAVVKSKGSGNPILTFGAPVYSKSKELVGIIGLGVNIEFLTNKVSSTKLGKTGFGFAVNKSGITVAHPNKDFILSLNVSETEGMKNFAARMTAGETGTENYSLKGVNKIGGFAPVPLAGWSVGITQDKSEIMAPANHLIIVIIVISLIFLAVAVAGVSFFARGIALPIGHVANDLNDASGQVAAASSQVASASQSLAEGSSEQASALEETSSSLEEMSSMTKQNAGNAAQAKALMAEAKQIVDKVDGQMHRMVTAIQDVTVSSEETGKIIKTIDEIAFQTNLLALNAAVEAARAGEAGAGFAVVADEVRNLAMRAAEAAKNTSNLIENTIVTVKNSRDLTSQTQEAFKENMEIAGKIGQLVDEIAAASQEQAQGIGQIGKAVAEMDKVVQQTAANAEESASASEEMNAQAVQMKNYVATLVQIIDGGSNGNGVRQSLQNLQSSTGQSGRGDLSVAKRPVVGRSKKLLNRGHDVPPMEKTARPDRLIPLENDGFSNF